VNCHGGPGVEWQKFSEGLRPDPPDLKELAPQRDPRQLFWVIKHGIKMTGMPSFGAIEVPDREIWTIAAFVKKLPNVSEADYKPWTAPSRAGFPPTALKADGTIPAVNGCLTRPECGGTDAQSVNHGGARHGAGLHRHERAGANAATAGAAAARASAYPQAQSDPRAAPHDQGIHQRRKKRGRLAQGAGNRWGSDSRRRQSAAHAGRRGAKG